MSDGIYLVSLVLIVATILIVYGMKHGAAVYQARSRAASEDRYRQLSQRAVQTQADTAATLATIQIGLADVAARLIVVERVLKEVG